MHFFNQFRRWGVEVELQSEDQRDFRSFPLRDGELPAGCNQIACLIHKITGKSVDIREWDHNHNNTNWIVKPDSSCGIEVCSPVSQGSLGIDDVCRVIDAFAADPVIDSDHNCSVHAHVEVSDCTREQVAAILTYWIKCEPVFLDAMPANRKYNRFCQPIGALNVVQHDDPVDAESIITCLSDQKYYSINAKHYKLKMRNTVEFRVMDYHTCLNSFHMKNWIKLLVHFVDMVKNKDLPPNYDGSCWSSYLWLDPKDVFQVLHFYDPLSEGMQQVRTWFLGRLYQNLTTEQNPNKFTSVHLRKKAYEEIRELIEFFKIPEEQLQLIPENIYTLRD